MKNKRFIGAMSAAALLLMVPAIAKLRDLNMLWDETDFIVAGVLLFGTAIVFELVARKASTAGNTLAYKAGAGMAVFTALFLIWSNLAVGIIGSEDNPANLMYLGVLATGFVGAIIGRFIPQHMAWAMFAAAAAQGLVMLIAVIGGLGQPWSGPVELLMINAVFIALWLGAGMLFMAAARPRHKPLKESQATS